MIFDPRAIYIHCDGSMMRDSKSSGGTGYVIKFPDYLEIENVSDYFGIYEDSNIERVEIQGIIEGMNGLLNFMKSNQVDLSRVSKIIIITDRFDLQDEKRTSPYKIKEWRANYGKNFEGKEIKNWDLLNKLDKTRNKLSKTCYKSVRIEYRQRKQNKEADKLSKKGSKEGGIPSRLISIEGHKIGRRKFDGKEIVYQHLKNNDTLIIHVFRKRLIKNQWEINAEICNSDKIGQKIKIITDYTLQEELPRGNVFQVRIKNSLTHHIEIYETIIKCDKKDYL